MNRRLPFAVAVACMGLVSTALAQSFHWDPHEAKVLAASQSLRTAKLTETDKAALTSAIEKQNTESEIGANVGRRHEAALDTRVLTTDLNHDGLSEVIAQPVGNYFCSPTGNCSFWVFRKSGNMYKLVLNGLGQTFTLQPNYTNGFRDIVVAMHGSAFDQTLKLYKYRNGRYYRESCYDASWQARDNPDVMLKEPRITPCAGCGC